jgi:hypothetical protein
MSSETLYRVTVARTDVSENIATEVSDENITQADQFKVICLLYFKLVGLCYILVSDIGGG